MTHTSCISSISCHDLWNKFYLFWSKWLSNLPRSFNHLHARPLVMLTFIERRCLFAINNRQSFINMIQACAFIFPCNRIPNQFRTLQDVSITSDENGLKCWMTKRKNRSFSRFRWMGSRFYLDWGHAHEIWSQFLLCRNNFTRFKIHSYPDENLFQIYSQSKHFFDGVKKNSVSQNDLKNFLETNK